MMKQYGTMRDAITVRVLVALCALAAASVSPSRSQTATLAGQVFDEETHQAVDNASVLLIETGDRKFTNKQGVFAFDNLLPGQHTVAVHHIAYADVERTVICGEHNDSLFILLHPSITQSGEIIVRGTRALSSSDNTPFPIDVARGDRLVQQSPTTISDALENVPGLSLVRDGIWGTALSIRGMSRSNIVTMVDNTRIETANDIAGGLSLFNVQDIERVETMKSPGSVLYGSGAFGGVIHIVSKRPFFSDQFQMAVEASEGVTSVDHGSHEYLGVESSTDRYALRLSGGYQKAGNTMTPDGILQNSQYRDFSLSDAMTAKTFGEQTLLVSYQRSQAEDTGIPGGAPIAASARARYTLARRERFGLEYVVPNMFPGIPLLTLRLSRQAITRNVEIIQNPTLTLTPHATNITLSGQLESQILPDANDCLTVGVEVWRRGLDSKRERIDKRKGQITGERPAPLSTFLSAGAYAQNEWHGFSSRIVMMMGARYDRVRVANDETMNPEYVITGGTLQLAPLNQILLWKKATSRDESWSMNAGVRYAITPSFDASFLVATAFRSPSLEERFQFIDLGGFVRIGSPGLQPERSLCLNTGLRLHLEELTIRTDVFLNQLSNLITEVPGQYEGRQAYIKTNIGTARLYGFEISGELSLSRCVVVKSSAAYARGRDTRNNTDLPQIPPMNGLVEITGHLESLGTLSVSCSGAMTQNKIALGEQRTPGYAVFDMDVASEPVTSEPLLLTIRSGIQNVFNRSYRNHLSTLRDVIKSEPGRNFFLSVKAVL